MHDAPSGAPYVLQGDRIYRGSEAPSPPSSPRAGGGGRNRRLRPSTAWAARCRLYAALRCAALPLLSFSAGVGGIALCTCGCLAFWDGVMHSPRLALRQIVVEDGTVRAAGAAGGRRLLSAAQVVALADVPLGSPLLLVDRDGVAQKIMRHPFVDRAVVHRQLPGRLTVRVREQRPSVLVSLKELYVANDRGELFKTFSAADKLNLPVVTGLPAQGSGLSTSQVQNRVQQSTALAAAISSHPMEISSLDELHWDPQVGWSAVVETLVSGEHRVRLFLGKTPQQRLPLALSTLRFLLEKSQTPAVIWADGSKNSGRVQVRLSDAPGHPSTRGAHGTES